MAEQTTTMYFNPSCSKCQYALEFLQAQGIQPQLIHYLEQHPTVPELKTLLQKLGLRPLDIIRTSEPLFAEKFAGKNFSNDEWLNVITQYPVLLQRPILVQQNKAGIGRSDEQLKEFIHSGR